MNPATQKALALGAALCVLAMTGSLARADMDRPPGDWNPPSVEERAARLADELDLDESQAARLVSILAAADEERQAMRERHEALIRADLCALKASTSEEIIAILTTDQAEAFEEIGENMAARRERWAGRPGRDHPPRVDCEDAGA